MKVIKSPGSLQPNIQIAGTIDESSDLSAITVENGEIHVDCYEIARINSVGVKRWINFFSRQVQSGVRVYFYRLSTALVDQFNLISNFNAGGKIMSVMLPFICDSCNSHILIEKTPPEIKVADFDDITWPCEKCGKVSLKFDDDPESYLYFLNL